MRRIERLLNWLFIDWEDTARRAIFTVGEVWIALQGLNALSDVDLALLDTFGAAALGGVLSVALAGIRGQWNTRRTPPG